MRVAGGDARLLEQLQAMAWSAYQAAGAPEGPDEDGMVRWWSARLDGMRN